MTNLFVAIWWKRGSDVTLYDSFRDWDHHSSDARELWYDQGLITDQDGCRLIVKVDYEIIC